MFKPQIQTVTDFVNHALTLRIQRDEMVAFRGHSDSTYRNTPSVLRTDKLVKNEHTVLRELVSLHPEEFHTDNTTLELLVRAQHYGLPTRLLDVTFNPLAGLFFACNNHPHLEGQVVAFIVKKERVKQYDSDTVSCLSNLAFLTDTEKKRIKSNLDRMLEEHEISDRRDIKNFRATAPMRRLLHFIRNEKPHFENAIKPHTLRQFVLVLPKRSNRRIVAQSGAFIVFGCHSTLNDDVSPKFRTERFVIPSDCKERICTDLSKLSINERTMFPEIDRAANFLNKQYVQK